MILGVRGKIASKGSAGKREGIPLGILSRALLLALCD
jgi:hypothetical protein